MTDTEDLFVHWREGSTSTPEPTTEPTDTQPAAPSMDGMSWEEFLTHLDKEQDQ